MTFNFARAHDQYLNPPDEPEAVFCEDCGEEMEEGHLTGKLLPCGNVYCPSKFDEGTVEREMAELLVGANETVKSLARKVKRLECIIRLTTFLGEKEE